MRAQRDDFAIEPLAPGERILWHGRPDAWRLAVEAFGLPWVAGYFAVLAVGRVAVSAAGAPLGEALPHAAPFLAIGAVACAVLWGLAWVQARATAYTLTDRRVEMRIGAALTLTLSLPYVKIAAARLDLRRGGTGTIALALPDDVRFSYLMTWPHARPWRMARTEPALRCVPDAAGVARILSDAAAARGAATAVTRRAPALPSAAGPVAAPAHPHAIAAE